MKSFLDFIFGFVLYLTPVWVLYIGVVCENAGLI